MRHNRRFAFTVIEILLVVALLGVISGVTYEAYTGAFSHLVGVSEHLSAVQSAMVLMEWIDEDIRQMAVLNHAGSQLVPNTMLFSTNAKSFMFRKSTLAEPGGNSMGSSFSIVLYQLVAEPSLPGAYTVRRVERLTDGTAVTSPGSSADEKVFRSLYLQDMRYDNVVELVQNDAPRTFIRVSLSAINTGGGANDSRTYFMTNVFEPSLPELVNSVPNSVGFARRFCISLKWNLAGTSMTSGDGYIGALPPTNWPDAGNFTPHFYDYVDASGAGKDVTTKATSGSSAFTASNPALSTKAAAFTKGALNYLTNSFGDTFKGRIVGQIVSRPSVPAPGWVESFTLDTTSVTPIDAQIAATLKKFISDGRGPGGVQDLGHLLGTTASDTAGMVTTGDASDIVNGG